MRYLNSLARVLQDSNLEVRQFLPHKLASGRGVTDHLYLIHKPLPGTTVSIEPLLDLSNFGQVRAIYLSGTYLIGYVITSVAQVTRYSNSYLFIGLVEDEKKNVKVGVSYLDRELRVLKNTSSDSYILLPALLDIPRPTLP